MACKNNRNVQRHLVISFFLCSAALFSFQDSKLEAQVIIETENPSVDWYSASDNSVAVLSDDGVIEYGNRIDSAGTITVEPMGTLCPPGMENPPPYCIPIIANGGGPCTKSMCAPGVGMAGNFDAITGATLSEFFESINSLTPLGN